MQREPVTPWEDPTDATASAFDAMRITGAKSYQIFDPDEDTGTGWAYLVYNGRTQIESTGQNCYTARYCLSPDGVMNPGAYLEATAATQGEALEELRFKLSAALTIFNFDLEAMKAK